MVALVHFTQHQKKVFIDRQFAATRPHPEDWFCMLGMFFMVFHFDSMPNAVVRFLTVIL